MMSHPYAKHKEHRHSRVAGRAIYKAVGGTIAAPAYSGVGTDPNFVPPELIERSRGYDPSRKQGDAIDYDAEHSTQWRTQQEAKGNPRKI